MLAVSNPDMLAESNLDIAENNPDMLAESNPTMLAESNPDIAENNPDMLAESNLDIAESTQHVSCK